jgi:hypothetical protein
MNDFMSDCSIVYLILYLFWLGIEDVKQQRRKRNNSTNDPLPMRKPK